MLTFIRHIGVYFSFAFLAHGLELANIINQAFLEPLEEYRLEQPLTKFPVPTDSPKLHEVSELRIMKLLATLNPSKA